MRLGSLPNAHAHERLAGETKNTILADSAVTSLVNKEIEADNTRISCQLVDAVLSSIPLCRHPALTFQEGLISVADPGVVRLVRTNYPSGN